MFNKKITSDVKNKNHGKIYFYLIKISISAKHKSQNTVKINPSKTFFPNFCKNKKLKQKQHAWTQSRDIALELSTRRLYQCLLPESSIRLFSLNQFLKTFTRFSKITTAYNGNFRHHSTSRPIYQGKNERNHRENAVSIRKLYRSWALQINRTHFTKIV